MSPDPSPRRSLKQFHAIKPASTKFGQYAALAALIVTPCLAQSDESVAVTAVRFWSLGGATRIAIESTADVEYRWDRLSNPDRVYFDLLGAMNRVGPKRRSQHVIPAGDGLLKQIRIAETQRDTRVVFDLDGPMEVTASQLANPARLIVELRPAAVRAPIPRASPESVVLPLSHPVAAKPAATKESPAPVRVVHTALPESTQELAPATPPVETPKFKSALPVGRPAKRDSNGNRSLVRVLGLKIGRVIIDPGHGGHDTGTIGRSGIMEKDIVLDVAKRLAALIEEQFGSEVILTRTDDTFVPLEQRTAFANEKRADLFLSIHVNSSRLRTVAGVETFYLNFSTSPADLEVAARENASSQKTVHELTELLEKIALKDKIEESREFASAVQTAVFPVSAKGNAHAKNRGVKKAPFVVLIGASMPSVLAEIGFVSNPREESLMRKPEHRQKLAEALYKGVAAYAATLSHFQVAKRDN